MMWLAAEPSLSKWMRLAFTGFGVFWVVVLLGLYLGIGALLKRHERLSRKSGGH